MNKKEFIGFTYDYKNKKDGTNKSKSEIEKSLNMVLDSLQEALRQGNDVTFIGFGTFRVRKRAARMGRNPQNKDEIPIPEYNQIMFRVGKTLKTTCNS